MAETQTSMVSLEAVRAATNPAFRFIVEIGGIPHAVFTECTLPVIEWEIEEVKEGGLNDYVHQLPGRRKSARLTLKNGVGNDKLADWFFKKSLEGIIERRQITIKLLNARDKATSPVMTWSIAGAFPIKWSGPQLKTNDNTIAIQTLELACGKITGPE